jgi:hypothetical protein
MTSVTTSRMQPRGLVIFSTTALIRFESGLRDRVREFIHAIIEGELDIARKWSVPPVTATAISRDRCWEPSAGWN